MLIVVMLCVVMLSAIMLNVLAPARHVINISNWAHKCSGKVSQERESQIDFNGEIEKKTILSKLVFQKKSF